MKQKAAATFYFYFFHPVVETDILYNPMTNDYKINFVYLSKQALFYPTLCRLLNSEPLRHLLRPPHLPKSQTPSVPPLCQGHLVSQKPNLHFRPRKVITITINHNHILGTIPYQLLQKLLRTLILCFFILRLSLLSGTSSIMSPSSSSSSSLSSAFSKKLNVSRTSGFLLNQRHHEQTANMETVHINVPEICTFSCLVPFFWLETLLH